MKLREAEDVAFFLGKVKNVVRIIIGSAQIVHPDKYLVEWGLNLP